MYLCFLFNLGGCIFRGWLFVDGYIGISSGGLFLQRISLIESRIAAFLLKELSKVRFAIDDAVQCGVVWGGEIAPPMCTSEAWLVEEVTFHCHLQSRIQDLYFGAHSTKKNTHINIHGTQSHKLCFMRRDCKMFIQFSSMINDKNLYASAAPWNSSVF